MYAYYYGSDIKDLNRFELLTYELPLMNHTALVEEAAVPKYNMNPLLFMKPTL